MAGNKYYYNSETCKYERVETKASNVLLVIGLFLLCVIAFSLGAVALGYKYQIFQSRKMIELKDQNSHLKHQYITLNKKLDETEQLLSVVQTNDKEIYRSIFDLEPLDKNIREAGTGGVQDYDRLIASGEAKEIISHKIKRLDDLNARLRIQIQSHIELQKAASQYDKMLSSKPAIQPISNKKLTRLASGFGWRIHPILKVKKFHYGIDFTAQRGTPIYATGDGRVSKVKTSLGGYGKEIEINHGFGFVTKYAHLQKFNVKLGQRVTRGDIIGEVGSTGSSTAPHLHYEIIHKGQKVNPVYYFFKDLDDAQFEEILRLSSIENKSLS